MKPSIASRPLPALSLYLVLLAPLAAQAAPGAELQASAGTLPWGSLDLTASDSFSQTVSPAKVGSSIVKALSDARGDGSYADATVDVGFGSLHAFSDAHSSGASSPGLYAGSSAQTEFIDYIKPWESSAIGFTNYTLTLAIGGTHSATGGFGDRPGYLAQAYVVYDLRDNRTGDVFAAGNWTSSDLVPSTTLIAGFMVPASESTDDLRIDVSLKTFTSANSDNDAAYLTAFADYSNTLVAHLDAITPGASTMGVSGFDYATSASVPEPATPLLLVVGGAALMLTRRRMPSRTLCR